MRLQAHGIETDLPPGWEGRIKLRGRPRGRVLDPAPAVPRPEGGPPLFEESPARPEDGPATTDAPAGTEPQAPAGRLQVEDGTGPTGNPGEEPHPVVHLANFALPEDRGDFGSGAVDVMGADDILVVLFEYGPESAGTALFRRRGLPTSLTPAMFSASALQRSRPGQAGCQLFFSVENRAFCCYTVLGRQANANRLLPGANATLAATRISPR